MRSSISCELNQIGRVGEVRECKGKRGVLKVGGGVTWSHQILVFLPAAMANTDDKFCRPGGFSGSGKGGELERRWRVIYRHGGESIKAVVRAKLRPNDRGVFGRVTNEISVRRKKKDGLTDGAHSQ
jgi:hypothetical protein